MEQKKSFNYWQIRTIIITMVGYALFYFVRKNFSYSEGGEAIVGDVYVQGVLTIYVNFDITYTIVYNLK